MSSGNTIAALSTPYGRGAISMIRVSGDAALEICSKVFSPKKRIPLYALDGNVACYGFFVADGKITDDGIATVYRAPASYTGEDLVELCCHGGILVTRIILQALYDAGAVPAKPGEYTKRAFINGKLRLSAAEAIMDIIDAESEGKLRLAASAGRGKLSGEVEVMYASLKTLIASAYAYIDYPDEDLTDVSPEDFTKALTELTSRAQRLKDTYKAASAINEGVKTVICGKPNVGKSSLLNLLCGEEAAIVTEIAGTTRDVITRTVICGEVMLKLSDTAGIHKTGETVEAIGVKRAIDELSSAGLILAVFDGSRAPDGEDEELFELLSCVSGEIIAVINKTDISSDFVEEYSKRFEHGVVISTKTQSGISRLKELAQSLFISGAIDYEQPQIINARQYSEISRALESLLSAKAAIGSGMTQDIACLDLEEAMAALCRLDGREVTEDITNEIFSKFCVGK